MTVVDKKFSYYLISGGFLILILVLIYFLRDANSIPVYRLPVYGPSSNGKKTGPTNHKIPFFSFTDQEGKVLTSDSVKNKIMVVDYFFTTCQSICPIMSSQMERLASEFSNDDDIVLLSHTVDPETDSVATLKEYALLHNANYKRWKFLTGKKSELYRLARTGYLLDAQENKNAQEIEEDFIHTQNFALIDKNKQIRGYYDGTDSVEITRLITDIKTLKKE